MVKVLIIGGGLSGLTCANQLMKSFYDSSVPLELLVVDSRSRLGGRLYSEEGIDLGAAWSWPSHDAALQQIITNMQDINCFPQPCEGMALIETVTGQIRSYGKNLSPSGEGSVRFNRSTTTIITALVDELQLCNRQNFQFTIKLNYVVRKVIEDHANDRIIIEADNQECETADIVVLAMPPKLIAYNIELDPPLPDNRLLAMKSTPTWMENTGKVAFIYETNFWRAQRLSGTVFSEQGPLRQIWDNSDDQVFALAGFVFDQDLHYLTSQESLASSPILQQLVNLFGAQALQPKQIVYKSWAHDPFTSITNQKEQSRSLAFGSPIIQTPHGVNGRIFFAGTETTPHENGHMNGAVIAGNRIAKEIYRQFVTA